MRQVLWVERWEPARLNRVMRGHWSNGHRLKKADRELVAVEASRHFLKAADGPRSVALHLVVPPGRRKPDPDSLWKSLLDALKAARLIVDDTPRLCRPVGVTYSRAEGKGWGAFIIIEDL